MEIGKRMIHVKSMEVHCTSSTYVKTADNTTSRNDTALTYGLSNNITCQIYQNLTENHKIGSQLKKTGRTGNILLIFHYIFFYLLLS